MIRVLLVEDEPLIGQGLRMWLKQTADLTVVGEAHTDDEALLLAGQLSPDVILLDLSAPPTAGIAATAALHAAVPRAAVVLLSLHDDTSRREQAQTAGAHAFVGKQEGVAALLAAIQAAGRGDRDTVPSHSKE